MTRTFSKLFAAGLISAVAGFSSGPLSTSAQAGLANIVKDGKAGGTIHVVSEDNQSWTKIQPSAFSFPVRFTVYNDPDRVWVVQGEEIDVTHHDLYDTNDVGTPLQGGQIHSDTKTLSGGTLYLTNDKRDQIIAACNAKLKPFATQQPQQQADVQIPLKLVTKKKVASGAADIPVDSPLHNWPSVDFTLPVICDGFTKDKTAGIPDGVQTPDNESHITKVELGLSTNGAVANGTLEYTGTCPMGITLNMGWFTNHSTTLKSYIKHKDLAGQHNWTSTTFNVNTNQQAQGGLWKNEWTDLISIPFAGSVPSNGGGGVAGGNNPGGLGFNPGGGGGGGGGLNPFGNGGGAVQAGNTGTNNGLTQYTGYFQLVAYKNKKTVPVLQPGGGWTNTTIYNGQKMSDWRKYIVTCEPQQNTAIPQIPGGVTNPDNGPVNPDDPLNIPVVQYDGELDLADSADAPNCSRQGQAVFKINSDQSSPIDYKLTCTGGRSWQGSVQMFANGANKYQGVAAKTFDISQTENVACVLNRVSGGNNHPLAIRAKQYNCIKRNVVTGAGGLQVEPKPDTSAPFVPGVVTTGQIDKKATDIIRKRKVEARRKAAAAVVAKRKAAVAAIAKRKAAVAAIAKRRAAAALAKRRAAAAALAKRRAVAAALARRKAVAAALARKRAAAFAKRRVAPKRRIIAPVRVKRFRAR